MHKFQNIRVHAHLVLTNLLYIDNQFFLSNIPDQQYIHTVGYEKLLSNYMTQSVKVARGAHNVAVKDHRTTIVHVRAQFLVSRYPKRHKARGCLLNLRSEQNRHEMKEDNRHPTDWFTSVTHHSHLVIVEL